MASRRSAFITGAASGIGRSAAIALARQSFDLTVTDVDVAGLQSLAEELRQAGSKVVVARCDVRENGQQAAAVRSHVEQFGSMHAALLNAGVGEDSSFYRLQGTAFWERCLDIDLRAVLVGVELCATAMQATGSRGTIVSIASAAGVFPVPEMPVYAAAKGGLVHFTRSAGGRLAASGITLCTVCPEFVDTPLVQKMLQEAPDRARSVVRDLSRPLLRPEQVADLVLACIDGRHQSGSVLLLLQSGKLVEPFRKAASPRGSSVAGRRATPPVKNREQLAAWAAGRLPRTFRKLQVHKLSSNFQEATRLVEVPMPNPPPPGQVLVRRTFVGINASDINYTSGRYHNSRKEAEQQLPFDAGFENVGVVAALGAGVSGLQVGDPVAAVSYGGFAEYALEDPKHLLRVPAPTPEAVALLVSGLTASIALEQCGRMRSGETVLVTAAAGGTGQFAVQLAKAAGNHVVATCSGGRKADLLRRLGADRIINYKTESLKEVLKREYPKGVDIVYEGVGGDFFDHAVNALAFNGRLIIIGMMTSYKDGWPASAHPGLAEKLLWKSAAVSGFFLLRHMRHARQHLDVLLEMMGAGRLVVSLDRRRFVGVEQVAEAVEYLQGGSSAGKVVVQLAKELPGAAAARM